MIDAGHAVTSDDLGEHPPAIFGGGAGRTTLRGVGIPSWVWFVIAVVAIGLGIALLIADRAQRTPNNKERRRWAGLRGWQFAESDRVLPTRWQRGVLAQHSGGTALDVVAGSTFTADGRRQVYVLDLDVSGRTEAVIVGVRCRRATPVTVELWLPDVPVPQESGLDLLGPVGSRYAFVVDVAAARRLLTPSVVEMTDAVGSDVTVVWLEEDWVLASLEPSAADPSRLEQVLRGLGEIADVIDPFEKDPNGSTALLERSADESPDPIADGVVEDAAEDELGDLTRVEDTAEKGSAASAGTNGSAPSESGADSAVSDVERESASSTEGASERPARS